MIFSLLKLITRRPKNHAQRLIRATTVISLISLTNASSAFAQICGSIGFYSPENFPVSGRLQSVAVGDFNLDGKHDLVTANAVTTVVSVLLGRGDGTFETSVDVNAGNNPGDAVVGDFNGDSKPDIAVANAGGNNISVLLNTCAAAPCSSPSFAAAVNYASGNRPRRLTLGDVNRDNVLDIAVANENSNSISVLLGNGNGTFQTKVDFNPIGTQPYDVKMGDFNGDNKLDMVAVNFGMGDTAAVFINTCNSTPCAAPSFAAAQTYAVGESPMGVTVADFNGDNRLDLATANYFSSDVSILLGNGNGTFQNAVNYPSASLPNNITATDLDGDSYLDLVTSVDVGSLISVFRGRGDGTFEAKVDFNVGQSGQSDVSKAVAAEDFNGDTLIDLAVAVDMFNNVSIMFNGCGDPPPSNTAPSITAGSALARTKGTGAANATIATVGDAETAAGSLTVTATTVPTGITVSNITNTNGTITADVAAGCAASAGANTVALTVTDGGAMTATANLTVNVTANVTAISAHPGNQTVVIGDSATFSVTASGAGLTYQWRKGGSPIGGANASSYTINTAALSDAGSYDVVVTGPCGSVTSNAATLTVNKLTTTTSVASSASPSVFGQSVTFTTMVATASSTGGTPTGTIQFLDGGTPIAGCTSVALSSGQAQCTTSALTVGNHTITAQYGGDGTFNASAGAMTGNPQVVAKATPTVTITSAQNPAEAGQDISFTATVSSTPGTPTGSVQFKAGGNNIGAPVALAANGTAVLVTSALPTGHHVVTADYGGDANFAASSGALSGDQIVLAQPELSISDVSVAEGDSGTTDAVFSVTLSAASSLPVSVGYASANTSVTSAAGYDPVSGTLLFAPGETSKSITVTVKGDQLFEPNETFTVQLSGAMNATIRDAEGIGTILNDDSEGGNIRFTSAEYNVSEGARVVTLSVERTGDVTRAATVNYNTPEDSNPAGVVPCSVSNGAASSRCDFTSAAGTLSFAPGETSKTFNILITQDSYTEGPETFQVPLLNPAGGAVLASPSTASITVIDDPVEPQKNTVDETEELIHQQYHDFLGREPDAPGLAFWTDNINRCHDPARRPADETEAQCLERQRETTSAAFFVSTEFQTTGSYVVRLYEGSLGRLPTYAEFIRDLGVMTNGIIVGDRLSGARINANGQTLATEFTGRPEFRAAYDSISDELYVNKLFETTGTTPTPEERQALVQGLGAGTETRESVLRKVVDGSLVNDAGMLEFRTSYGKAFYDKVYNRTFVLMEYFGYLRRDPDEEGYRFWLEKINRFGDYLDAEMVKSFLISEEFRKRFGQQ